MCLQNVVASDHDLMWGSARLSLHLHFTRAQCTMQDHLNGCTAPIASIKHSNKQKLHQIKKIMRPFGGRAAASRSTSALLTQLQPWNLKGYTAFFNWLKESNINERRKEIEVIARLMEGVELLAAWVTLRETTCCMKVLDYESINVFSVEMVFYALKRLWMAETVV